MTALPSVIDRVNRASTSELVVQAFDKVLADVGADYFGAILLPRPDQRVEDVVLARRVPSEWRALYSEKKFLHKDPAVRHCTRTVLPFDKETAPYDPETETHMGEVVERARDFNLHKGIVVPIPSLSGMVGAVGVVGPHFDEREVHKPLLHSLALHVFHRLDQLHARRPKRTFQLTNREREVLSWVSDGKTAWETGCILKLSTRTVEWHLSQAYQKLGAMNRAQAIALFALNKAH